MKKILIIALFLATTFLLVGCTEKQVCENVQVPYQEEVCTNALRITTQGMTNLDNPALSATEEECPEKGGLINYGNTQVTWEFINQNNILLSTNCNLLIRRNDFFTHEVMDEQQIEAFTVNIPAQGTKTVTKNVDLPKCYDFVGIECKDTDELPECKPITKYRTEQKCE